jgi:hypothetical protein
MLRDLSSLESVASRTLASRLPLVFASMPVPEDRPLLIMVSKLVVRPAGWFRAKSVSEVTRSRVAESIIRIDRFVNCELRYPPLAELGDDQRREIMVQASSLSKSVMDYASVGNIELQPSVRVFGLSKPFLPFFSRGLDSWVVWAHPSTSNRLASRFQGRAAVSLEEVEIGQFFGG